MTQTMLDNYLQRPQSNPYTYYGSVEYYREKEAKAAREAKHREIQAEVEALFNILSSFLGSNKNPMLEIMPSLKSWEYGMPFVRKSGLGFDTIIHLMYLERWKGMFWATFSGRGMRQLTMLDLREITLLREYLRYQAGFISSFSLELL